MQKVFKRLNKSVVKNILEDFYCRAKILSSEGYSSCYVCGVKEKLTSEQRVVIDALRKDGFEITILSDCLMAVWHKEI